MHSTAQRQTLIEDFDFYARKNAAKTALIEDRPEGVTKLSFAELATRINNICAHLQQAGLVKGTKVLCMAKPTINSTAFIFALVKSGAVPVLIDPGMGLRRMLLCIEQTQPEFMLGEPIVMLLKLVFRKAFRSIGVNYCTHFLPGLCHRSIEGLIRTPPQPFKPVNVAPDDLAAITFTSGSTGVPKGVELTHRAVSAHQKAWDQCFHLNEDHIDLATFPLYLLLSNASGRTSVIPSMDFSKPGSVSPRFIYKAALAHKATLSFGSPALWERVVTYMHDAGLSLPDYRIILTGGAPVRADLLRRIKRVMPNAQAFALYGASEATPMCYLEEQELSATDTETDAGGGVCVGYTMGDLQLRVIPLFDQPIPDWSATPQLECNEVGELVVSGSVVSRRYHDLDAKTLEAKIFEGDTVWHRLGDTGRVDPTGKLWLYGRMSHVCEYKGTSFYSLAEEGLFQRLEHITRCALINVSVAGERVLALVLEKHASMPADIEAIVSAFAREKQRPIERIFLYPESFPVDARHNAKIDRAALAHWAQQSLQQ